MKKRKSRKKKKTSKTEKRGKNASSNECPSCGYQMHETTGALTYPVNGETIRVPKIRAYAGKNVFLVAPTIIGSRVVCSFIIWEFPEKEIEIVNIDANKPEYPKADNRSIIIESELTSDFAGYSTGNVLDIVSYGGSEQ